MRTPRPVTVSRSSTLVKTALRGSARGDYRLAEQRLQQALKLARSSTTLSEVGRPALWNELGMVCKYLGKFDKAERYYRRALRYARRFSKTADREFFLADLYHNLGGLEHARQHFSRAETYARKGLQLRLGCAKPDSIAVAADRAALAAILDGLDKHAESERHYRAALRTYRREYGPDHLEIALILNNLGALCQATGRTRRAEFYCRSALEMKRRKLGDSHPDVAVTMNNLGMLYVGLGKSSLARVYLQQAVQILKATLGARHPSTRAVGRMVIELSDEREAPETATLVVPSCSQALSNQPVRPGGSVAGAQNNASRC